VICDIIWNYDL